jgi:hypothetical protein
MPRKTNNRKKIQAARRKTAAEEHARKNKKWPGTRRSGAMLGTLIAAHMVEVLTRKGGDA